jgi:hypothetical protein
MNLIQGMEVTDLKYSDMLREGIKSSGYSLSQISMQLKKNKLKLDRALLSKMQHGKYPPAKDDINVALAKLLNLDPDEFRLAAAKEKLPQELYDLISRG